MEFPEKITVAGEDFKSLGGRYYASRLGKILFVTFSEDGEIKKTEDIFKPSVKEG